jgi:sugar phosphate isomerase/epimerase
MPRFAVRVYLHDGKSFVNARRIAAFCDQARQWGRRRAPRDARLEFVRRRIPLRRPAWPLLKKNTCIADSLLQKPSHMDGWHVLTAPLGEVYGEDPSVEGTPYVRHIPLSGGGLCAQAVCFLATTLLHEQAQGVYGVAEVTALAVGDEKQELLLRGLNEGQMIRYFRRVGLCATYQVAGRNLRSFDQRAEAFRAALEAYLYSDMPVILPLDALRMEGYGMGGHDLKCRSIFARNGLSPGQHKCVRPRRHAVLLVGCNGNGAFAFNDPRVLPFMHAATRQFIDAACYASDGSRLVPRVFLPVTPERVRLPLERWQSLKGEPDAEKGGTRRWGRCLLDIADRLQSGLHPGLPEVPVGNQPGQLRLVTTEGMTKADGLPEVRAFVLRQIQRELRDRGWPKEHCFWLQAFPSGIWVWDAEMEPPPRPGFTRQRAESYLACVHLQQPTGWELVYSHGPANDDEQDGQDGPDEPDDEEPEWLDPSRGADITPSLISSFSVLGLRHSLDSWTGPPHCELYAFMQADTQDLLPTTRRVRLSAWHQNLRYTRWARRDPSRPVCAPIVTVVERMAALRRAPSCREVADAIAAFLDEAGLKLSSVATFLPGISARGLPARRAWRALSFLVRLAARLKETHPVSTIEIVAGSLIDGVWPATDRKVQDRRQRKVYVANRLPPEAALERLLEALRPIAEDAGEAGLQFALEFEPGPLFVLGKWCSLKRLCRMLTTRENRDLSPVLGVNLDVAHFTLGDITPEEVLAERAVYDRIAHCHVSDHGKGHFGDLPLGTVHSKDHFSKWVQFVRLVAAESKQRGAHLPKFSGFISTELEACKDSGMVRTSRKRLAEILVELQQLPDASPSDSDPAGPSA